MRERYGSLQRVEVGRRHGAPAHRVDQGTKLLRVVPLIPWRNRREFGGGHSSAAGLDLQTTSGANHALLDRYAILLRGSPRRNDLVPLLLKKRLFSSPAAFARTVAQHAQTVRGLQTTREEDPWDTGYDDNDEPDDSVGSDRSSFRTSATVSSWLAGARRRTRAG